MATPQDLDAHPTTLGAADPPARAHADPAADERARTYTEALATYEAERRAAGVRVLRGMAVQSGAAPSAARG